MHVSCHTNDIYFIIMLFHELPETFQYVSFRFIELAIKSIINLCGKVTFYFVKGNWDDKLGLTTCSILVLALYCRIPL